MFIEYMPAVRKIRGSVRVGIAVRVWLGLNVGDSVGMDEGVSVALTDASEGR
jgi:hypothetical protein